MQSNESGFAPWICPRLASCNRSGSLGRNRRAHTAPSAFHQWSILRAWTWVRGCASCGRDWSDPGGEAVLSGALDSDHHRRYQSLAASIEFEDDGRTATVVGQPLLLGMLLAAGFETSSQLSALILAGEGNPWFLGAVFSLGMVIVDGIDGALAASTERQATLGASRAIIGSRVLGMVVVIFSLGIGFSELAGFELDRAALPMGIGLFIAVVGIRIWARMPSAPAAEKIAATPNATDIA